jgi:hypothetical protein
MKISDKVTGKVGYVVSYNMRKLSAEVPEYEKMRDEIIEKYGEKDENGVARIQIGTEAFDKFSEEMKQYDEMSFEINILKVNPEDLESSDLTAKEMISISFMIDDDEEN